MRFVVLGGGGSFGLAVSRFLLQQDGVERVVGIGRNPPKPAYFTLGTGDGDPRYEYRAYHLTYELDLLIEFLQRERPDVIVNFAAQGEGATSFSHSWRYFETNAMGLVRLLDAVMDDLDYLPRFIHIGTSELYGATDGPANEDTPIKPTSPYAASKAAFDLCLLAMSNKMNDDLPVNIIRPSNCYGPGQQLHRLIPRAMLCGLTGKKLPLQGGGVAKKSYMHTDDLAAAIWAVLHRGRVGQVYNAGPMFPISIREVVAKVADVLCLGFDQLCELTEDRVHQDSQYWLDSSKLRQLGWKPSVTWEEGLTQTRDWVESYLPELRQLPQEFIMRG